MGSSPTPGAAQTQVDSIGPLGKPARFDGGPSVSGGGTRRRRTGSGIRAPRKDYGHRERPRPEGPRRLERRCPGRMATPRPRAFLQPSRAGRGSAAMVPDRGGRDRLCEGRHVEPVPLRGSGPIGLDFGSHRCTNQGPIQIGFTPCPVRVRHKSSDSGTDWRLGERCDTPAVSLMRGAYASECGARLLGYRAWAVRHRARHESGVSEDP